MKKPKITHKHLMVVIIVLAGFMIASALLYGAFGYAFPQGFMKNASNVVIVVALGVLIMSRKIAKDNEIEARKKKDEEEAAEQAKAVDNADADEAAVTDDGAAAADAAGASGKKDE